jgi:hypothetical protein
MPVRGHRRTSPRDRGAAAAVALAAALAGCVASGETRGVTPAAAPPAPGTCESRTGVPLLMDLPLVGWLFQHRVTAR